MTWTSVWFLLVSSSISKHPTPAREPARPPEELLISTATTTTTPRTCRPVNPMRPSAQRTVLPPQRMELWTRMRKIRVVSRRTPRTSFTAVRLCLRTLLQPPSGTVHPCLHILMPPCQFHSLNPMLTGKEQRPRAHEGKRCQGLLRAPKNPAQGKAGQGAKVEPQRGTSLLLVHPPPALAQHQQNPHPMQALSLPLLVRSVCTWIWLIFPLEPRFPRSASTSSGAFDLLATSSAATVRSGRS